MFKKNRRFRLETFGRVGSRGGDLLWSNAIMYYSGESLFLFATLAGAIWNGIFDFSWQRFVVYPKRPEMMRLLKNSIPYVILRLSIAGLGFGTLSTMFFQFGFPYHVASLSTTFMIWGVSYQTTRVFFTGSSKHLPRGFRLPWIALRLATRTRVHLP